MFYVYVLKTIKGTIYTGYTSDLKRRMIEHNLGNVISTRNKIPLNLVYYEAYLNEKDARNREKYLKGGGKAKNDLKLQIINSLTI